jgi:hypothetical protein
MNTQNIYSRLGLLYNCLVFCSDYRTIFSTYERIMINQERGRLLHMLSHPLESPLPVSKEIEEKIVEVLRLQKMYKFENINKDILDHEY